jgi:hypothetical protein
MKRLSSAALFASDKEIPCAWFADGQGHRGKPLSRISLGKKVPASTLVDQLSGKVNKAQKLERQGILNFAAFRLESRHEWRSARTYDAGATRTRSI